ncbi:SgcJ/EcaC family oxidoreductase [Flavobacterium sp. MC2016-06]|uniref:YybH family protein n=1 Tax=Flavobacterium sp. MC2016-06 TaxID=2676308 RepID=UPI0012BA6571|nr:SgcJ/EcaC family oxidoreductase [Flavobacterium sp. MC2016-06]MBU3857699.1 SgcJ/EcaC family oxidoreductase [Flavobacterium sp. MC2016-06]
MKKIIITTILLVTLAACQNKLKNNSNNLNKISMNNQVEKLAIEKLLFSYRDALNASDVNKVLPLYTNDGVFMPSNAPSANGQQQIKDSYEFVFKAIQLNIEFYIDEIEIDGNFAFARTTSKGTTLIHANGQTVPEENRELFVFEKANGQWKIARYMFNKMK